MTELRIALEEVRTPEQVEQLRQMFFVEDVEQNLDVKDSPKDRPGKFAGKLAIGEYQAHLWRLKATGEVVGMFFLYCSRLKSQGIVEVDAAVPDAKHRRQGYPKDAMVALFDHWLLEERAQALWAWIDERNEPSIRMLQALSVPLVARDVPRVTVKGERIQTAEARITKADWIEIRKRLPFAWPAGHAP